MKFKKITTFFLSFLVAFSCVNLNEIVVHAASTIKQSGEVSTIKEYGIDVSKHNGDIDWEKIADCDVDFAIIRAGYTCSDDPSKDMDDDPRFEYNYQEAKKAGIKVGVYFYSYALNVTEAVADANALIKRLEGKQLEYPVFYDMEDKTQLGLTVDERTKIANSFIKQMNAAGYYAGVYANANWFNNKLDYETLVAAGPIWWASWPESGKADINYNQYGMWQYSSKGRLNGASGNLDLNVSFVNYERIMKNTGLNGFGTNQNSFFIGVIPPVTYSGTPPKPNPKVTYGGVTLVKGKDYTISYYHNTRAGLAVAVFKGIGVYEGCFSRRTFSISRKSLSNVTLQSISSREYTGSAITPTIKLYDGKNLLVKDRDYKITLSNNKNIGTATVKIIGMNYKGDKTATFKITKRNLDNCNITLSSSSVTYNAKYRKPSVTVKVGSKTVASKYYTVSYSNNKKPGKATVTIKAKSGNAYYTGSTKAYFIIKPKKQTISKLSATSKGKLKVTVRKDSTVSGYQILYSTKKDFKTYKKVNLAGANKNVKTLAGLKSKKTYYIKVRAYKKAGSKTYYSSSWSTVKYAKIK